MLAINTRSSASNLQVPALGIAKVNILRAGDVELPPLIGVSTAFVSRTTVGLTVVVATPVGLVPLVPDVPEEPDVPDVPEDPEDPVAPVAPIEPVNSINQLLDGDEIGVPP